MLMVFCILLFSMEGCGILRRGFGNAFRSDEDLADEMAEKIIACIEAEDAGAFTELFSKSVQDSTPSLSEQAEECMEFYQGKTESCEGNASSKASSEYGETVLLELNGHYKIITDAEQYVMAFQYCPLDGEEPDKVGLTSVEIATAEAFDEEDFRWIYTNRPGIYVQD